MWKLAKFMSLFILKLMSLMIVIFVWGHSHLKYEKQLYVFHFSSLDYLLSIVFYQIHCPKNCSGATVPRKLKVLPLIKEDSLTENGVHHRKPQLDIIEKMTFCRSPGTVSISHSQFQDLWIKEHHRKMGK